jgi:hypothetical protein
MVANTKDSIIISGSHKTARFPVLVVGWLAWPRRDLSSNGYRPRSQKRWQCHIGAFGWESVRCLRLHQSHGTTLENIRLQPLIHITGWMTHVRVLEADSGQARDTKIADDSYVAFASTHISHGSYTESVLFTSKWPIVFFLSPQGNADAVSANGLILRQTEQGEHERIGNLQRSITCSVERLGEDDLRLTAHLSNSHLPAVLECVRRTITLV